MVVAATEFILYILHTISDITRIQGRKQDKIAISAE